MSDSNHQDPYEAGSLDELCDLLLEEEGVAPSESARRPLLETLAMLPFELESVELEAGVKEQLFDRIASERQAQGSANAEAPPTASVHSMAEHRSAIETSTPAPMNAAVSTASKPGWLLPIAASLLLAIGSLAYFQRNELQAQRAVNAQIQSQFDVVESKLEALEQDRDLALTSLAQASQPGTEACALKPRLASTAPQAHGTIYFMPEGEGWVLSLDGLEDVPGKTYQLWFLNDEAAMSGGTFLTGNRPYMWTHDKMPPPGTRGVAITLEVEGGATAPTGPEVLFGDAEDMISFL